MCALAFNFNSYVLDIIDIKKVAVAKGIICYSLFLTFSMTKKCLACLKRGMSILLYVLWHQRPFSEQIHIGVN